ncbi:MAG: hypothetical protein ACKOEQ_04175 [Verrucomicrobiota bacterium]
MVDGKSEGDKGMTMNRSCWASWRRWAVMACLALACAWAGGMGMAQTAGVTPEDALRLGQEWEAKLLRGDYGAVTGRMEWIRMAGRALVGVPGTPQAKAAFVQALATNAAAAHDRRLRSYSSFRLLGVARTNDMGGVVLRSLLPDGGVDFLRYRLERDRSALVVGDLYVLSNGEWFSESARRAYILAEARKGVVWTTGVKPVETELMRAVGVLDRALGLAQKGLAKEVLEVCQGLPVVVQADRSVLLMRLSAALAADPAQFQSLSAEWPRLHPWDPGLDLLTFERLAREGKHGASAAALRRIEAFVGGDPHLHALAGAELALAGQPDEGRRMVEESVAVEPSLATGYDAAIGIELHFKRHAEVAQWLNRAADHLAADPKEVVRTQPQYEAFRSSPEGIRWLDSEPDAKVVGGVRKVGAKPPPAIRSDPTLPEPPPDFGRPSASTNKPMRAPKGPNPR